MKSSRRASAQRGHGPIDHFDSAKTQRKTRQLCRQVQRTLSYIVPGELGDPILQDLWVESVEPAPDASRLLVIMRTTRSANALSGVLERLEHLRGRLRAEVAAAITRKRAPELMIQLRPAAEVQL